MPPIDRTQKYIPEDDDQALVNTPYGKGIVVRTRPEDSIQEILLVDTASAATKQPKKQHETVLYSPTTFSSITPQIGDDVKTLFGRGRVMDKIQREDTQTTTTLVVRISSWRLAGRSTVTCYLRHDDPAIHVLRKKRPHAMTAFEKVEYALELKQQAAREFASKDYHTALQSYAKAVDAVRYVQHASDSTNEVRADLLSVMITCSNNAATCSVNLKDWERAHSFGKNALVLLNALESKMKDGSNSRILTILHRDGHSNTKLFGTWKVKSLIVMAKALMERHDVEAAMVHLKTALEEPIATYKLRRDEEQSQLYTQLLAQEREVIKLLMVCKEQRKAEKKKEKERARAMFGNTKTSQLHSNGTGMNDDTSNKAMKEQSEQHLDSARATHREKNAPAAQEGTPLSRPANTSPALSKRVSFADGKKPGEEDIEPGFFEEHLEALVIIGVVSAGALMTNLFWKRRV